MLTFTGPQLVQFRTHAEERFIRELQPHLERFAPHHYRALGADGVRQTVLLGLRRAADHGFTERGPVRSYLELMFMFGSYFDIDPQLPAWASEVFRDGKARQIERATALYNGVLDYIRRVSGDGHKHALSALSRLDRLANEQLQVRERSFRRDVHDLFMRIYPEKYSYTGEQPHEALIAASDSLAQRFEIASVRGRTLLCVLMFMTGCGVHSDPLYPWVTRTLNDERILTGARRAEKLESNARAYLARVLRNLGGI